MTAAIGFPFANERRRTGSKVEIDGILVCADTRITASDYATSHGSKVSVSITPSGRAFVIANASEDIHAAEMLASEIMHALCDDAARNLEATIKQTMQAWYSAYSGGTVPTIEYIIGASVDGDCSLLYCSPPNTVLHKFHPFAIGSGARVIEPLLPDEMAPLWKLEPTILRAAYSMYHAKKDEGAFVGGKTDAAVIDKEANFAFLEHSEIEEAEKISKEVDDLFGVLLLGLFSRETAKNRRSFMSGFSKLFTELSTKATNIRLDSLKSLDELRKMKERKKAKQI